MPAKADKSPTTQWAAGLSKSRFVTRYAVSIGLILAVMLASHMLTHLSVLQAAKDSELVDLSRKQPLLTQRILYLADRITIDPRIEDMRQLNAATTLLELNHQRLKTDSGLPRDLRILLYEHGDNSVDPMVRRLAELARVIAGSEPPVSPRVLREIMDLGSLRLLVPLEEIVAVLEARITARLNNLAALQMTAFAFVVLAILAEVTLILRPAMRSVFFADVRLQVQQRRISRLAQLTTEKNQITEDLRQQLATSQSRHPDSGLINRQQMIAELDRMLAITDGPNNALVSVLTIRIPRLSELHDIFSIAELSMLIAKLGKALLDLAPDGAVVAQLDGESLALAYFGATEPHSLCDAIIDAIAEPHEINNEVYRLGAQVAWHQVVPQTCAGEEILSDATVALHEGPRNGPGPYFAFDRVMRATQLARQSLWNDLQAAVERREFQAFFQPQVNLDQGGLSGLEMLARWRHPERGLLMPNAFIEMADEVGLIARIDEIVLTNGLDELARLRAEGWTVPTVSINVSDNTLRDPGLVDKLIWDLEMRDLGPSDLIVEILESTLINLESDSGRDNVRKLRDAGFKVELDDFGVGFASFAALSKLAIHGVKLDRTLIRALPDAGSEAIVRAIIRIASELDLKVTAEGVETPAHMSLLQDLGCDAAQGFGISKPMAADDLVGWLKAFDKTAGVVGD